MLNTDILNQSISNMKQKQTDINIEYELQLEPDVHDLCQLRGNANPTWCPGFFISVPHQVTPFEVTQLEQMLAKVWREMSPLMAFS